MPATSKNLQTDLSHAFEGKERELQLRKIQS